MTAQAIPAGHVALPTLTRADWDERARWWRPETGVERRCATCASPLVNEPPRFERFGRVFCLYGCGREAAFISGVGL